MRSVQEVIGPVPRRGFWPVVRDALRGVQHDYTDGSIGRVILMLAVPRVLEMAMELGNAAATMVGQAFGAGKPDRAERAVWLAGRYNMVFLTAVGVVFVLAARPIIHIFTSDPAIVPFAVGCLRIVALGFPFYPYGMVLTQAFNGAGDTWTPTWINFACFWLWEIPLAWLLSTIVGLGPHGAFIAITAAFSTVALVSAVLFRRGRWKRETV